MWETCRTVSAERTSTHEENELGCKWLARHTLLDVLKRGHSSNDKCFWALHPCLCSKVTGRGLWVRSYRNVLLSHLIWPLLLYWPRYLLLLLKYHMSYWTRYWTLFIKWQCIFLWILKFVVFVQVYSKSVQISYIIVAQISYFSLACK